MARILVVDDEKSIRITLKEFLAQDGHSVEVAGDADEGICLLKKKGFDVVLADIILPRVTGVNLLKAIRKASPDVKVIMMTGEPTVETATESLRAGAFDYLFKPISKDVVLKIVRNAADVKILEDEKRRLEEENRQHREELERMVEERTKSFQESEKRFRLAFENANDGIALVNTDGSIIEVNQRISDNLGYSKEELECMNVKDFTHPEDLDVSPKFFTKSIKAEIDSAIFEKRYIHKDGHTIWGQVSISTLRDSKDAPLYFISHLQDITPRKNSETELKRSKEQLRKLAAHLQLAIENERVGIARDIHDDLGPTLSALKMDLSWINKRLLPEQDMVLKKIDSMKQMIDSAVQHVKKICVNLRPAIIDDLGLEAGIEWLVSEFQQRTGISCDLSISTIKIISDQELSTVVFRIAQEALTNILRHAQATKVEISLERKDENLILKIKDNGIGISGKEMYDLKNFGLIGMSERAISMGGVFKLTGNYGEGVLVYASFPVTNH